MNVVPNYRIWALMKREFEGFRSEAYQDGGGVWTLGWGSTYNHIYKRKVKQGDKINFEESLVFLQIDCIEIVRQANFYIKKPLNVGQSTAICDYIYNRGIGNFLKTQLDELINENPSNPAILKEIKRTGLWDRIGKYWWGLERRRLCEAHLYETGELKMNFKK